MENKTIQRPSVSCCVNAPNSLMKDKLMISMKELFNKGIIDRDTFDRNTFNTNFKGTWRDWFRL
jgi:hypothetical protein